MIFPSILVAAVSVTALWPSPAPTGLTDSFDAIESDFAQTARPLIRRFCLECHAANIQEGDLDLEQFESLTQVRRAPGVWQKVAEMLDNGEMPPKKAAQPSVEQRRQLRGWVERYLNAEAKSRAGDPGPVVPRRLNNAEYTHTVRDLTGVPMDPTREFPTDSAAGEGFTNTGSALVMSPALLTKYLDAAKEIARHAVLLPDGFRFSPSTTRADWTREILDQIRSTYRQHSDAQGGTRVNLQGIVFDTNDGGRLPVEKYLEITLAERANLLAGSRTIEDVAREHGLSAKYLGLLWRALTDKESSQLLDIVRSQWRESGVDGAIALATAISRWQSALWRFASVGHIGKVGGPKAWQEPLTPLTPRQELRLRLAAPQGQKEITLFLVAGDAGDGNEQDYVIWERPRLVLPGGDELLLRDARDVIRDLVAHRERLFAGAEKYLVAAAAANSQETMDLQQLAKLHGVDRDDLVAWLDLLGIGGGTIAKIDSLLLDKIPSSAGYDFVKGWGASSTPNVVANSSDQHVRIPGNMKPHSVAMHPSPRLQVVAGWRSPVTAKLRVEATVQHAHPECGNGVTWSLEWRRGNTRRRLLSGIAQGANEVPVGPLEDVSVRPGDLVSLLIGPRDGNHACDLTAVDITLSGGERQWNLARDVSPDVLAGNPHADGYGNSEVWHFYTEPIKENAGHDIPAGSLLAKWQAAENAREVELLAKQVQELLVSGPPDANDHPDAKLYQQLASLSGPLLGPRLGARVKPADGGEANSPQDIREPRTTDSNYWAMGLERSRFGTHPAGESIEAASLCLRAPAVIEVRLPADLATGTEFVSAGFLHAGNPEGSVQLQVLTARPERDAGLVASEPVETQLNVPWTSVSRRVSHNTPIIAQDGGAARQRWESAFDAFRAIFPAALCYTKIVPVDEVVTLTLYYREDDHLRRLMLDDRETARLDRLWDELHFVSHDALKLVEAFQQLLEYATQDADPKVFEPLRGPIHERAAAFRRTLEEAEPRHVDALVEFAARVFRRPLSDEETRELKELYGTLREQEIRHDDAFRLTLARLFASPAFLYRFERVAPDALSAPVSNWELATRLSYFLWSSVGDAELRECAAAQRLHEPDVLVAQTRRMLRDERVRRLATEFACQWLHIHSFDKLDEKSERHFPSFAALRGDMYEESIRFFMDLFQQDGSILSILDADHTFLNESLARHYGIPDVTGSDWRRVDDVKRYARGGILAHATTLAKQSGASRTSPILRGNWVSETLLGEKLPRPPKDVPQLPEDERDTEGLTVRALVEQHSSDPRCAKCHVRIDPLGFALEGYDAIGARRDKDLGDRPIDTSSRLRDGTELEGLDGLRQYLSVARRDDFVRQFCRKLLGYALGRSVQLSDQPLLDKMCSELARNDYRFSAAVETIVTSRQFRHHRGGAADLDADTPSQ